MLSRWGRFNLVGVLGMLFQLLLLWALNRLLGGRYLLASVLALELTLVHNFCWHRHYTWRERADAAWHQLLRFHIANGSVSLIGNVLLMRLLVAHLGLPVIVANLLAIVCCSLVNFALGEVWCFA